MNFDANFENEPNDPSIHGVDALNDIPVTPEELSYFSHKVRNAVDIAILRSMGSDLAEVPKSEATLSAEDEITELLASGESDPLEREAYIARRKGQQKSTSPHWPFEAGSAEQYLVDRAIAKEPQLEATQPRVNMANLFADGLSIKLDSPLWEGLPDTAVIERLEIIWGSFGGLFSVGVLTQKGYEITYTFNGAVSPQHQNLGGMLGAEEADDAYSLNCMRSITMPDLPDEDLVGAKVESGEIQVTDEDAFVLRAFAETIKREMWLPSPMELMRLARAINSVTATENFAERAKLNLQLAIAKTVRQIDL